MQAFRRMLFLAKGLREFTRGGYERSARKFAAGDTDVDLRGRRVLVTGANSGLGLTTSMELARRGATVFMLCRNEARGAEAVEQVRQASGNADVHLRIVDLSSMQSVRAFASAWAREADARVDVLVNNAGMLPTRKETTSEGFDVSFATNTLNTWLLTVLLLPHIRASPARPARVITVSSGGMYQEDLRTHDLNLTELFRTDAAYDGTRAYSISKRHQVALTEEFARRHAPSDVVFVSMHPGWAATPGVRTSLPGFEERMGDRIRSPEQGADTIVWLCCVPADRITSGEFYLDRHVANKHMLGARTSYKTRDVATLWRELESIAGLQSDAS